MRVSPTARGPPETAIRSWRSRLRFCQQRRTPNQGISRLHNPPARTPVNASPRLTIQRILGASWTATPRRRAFLPISMPVIPRTDISAGTASGEGAPPACRCARPAAGRSGDRLRRAGPRSTQAMSRYPGRLRDRPGAARDNRPWLLNLAWPLPLPPPRNSRSCSAPSPPPTPPRGTTTRHRYSADFSPDGQPWPRQLRQHCALWM